MISFTLLKVLSKKDTEPFEWDDSDNVYHTPENEPNEQDELDNNDNDGGQQVEGGGSRNRTLTSPENNVVAIQRQNVNKTTTDDIRREIFKKQNFDVNYSSDLSEDFDWIRHSVYTMLRLYESDKLKKAHRESRYPSQVWNFIDSAFDNIRGMRVATFRVEKY